MPINETNKSYKKDEKTGKDQLQRITGKFDNTEKFENAVKDCINLKVPYRLILQKPDEDGLKTERRALSRYVGKTLKNADYIYQHSKTVYDEIARIGDISVFNRYLASLSTDSDDKQFKSDKAQTKEANDMLANMVKNCLKSGNMTIKQLSEFAGYSVNEIQKLIKDAKIEVPETAYDGLPKKAEKVETDADTVSV